MIIDLALRRTVPGFDLDVAFRSDAPLTAIFGRSGSGKSMTLGLIAGIQKPDGGHLKLGTDTMIDIDRGILVPLHRRRISLVFQDAQLFPHLNVRRNLVFGQWFASKRASTVAFDQVVDTLDLGKLLMRYPGRLSGGERQRVAIGRALLARPRLLLFDEPLASLDRRRKLDILPMIERMRDEFAIPVVYVTHALDEVVRLAATVVLIDRGRVTAVGTPDVILADSSDEAQGRFARATVVATTIGDSDAAFGLTALDHPAGTLWLAGPAGPRGRAVNAVVRATDVSLAPGAVGPLSIRSSLTGTIAAIADEGALAAVTIALDGHGTLLALVTRRALFDLGLAKGSIVRALIKTVALDEGTLPGPGSGGRVGDASTTRRH